MGKVKNSSPSRCSLRADQWRKSHPKTGWICKTPQQHPPQVQPTTLLLHYDGATLCVIMLNDLSVRATVHSSRRPPLPQRDKMQHNCACVHMTYAFMWSPCELRLQYLYLRWPSGAAGTRTNSYLSFAVLSVSFIFGPRILSPCPPNSILVIFMIIILFFKCQNPPYALLLQHGLFVSGPTRSKCSRPPLQVYAEPELKGHQPTNSDSVKYKVWIGNTFIYLWKLNIVALALNQVTCMISIFLEKDGDII